jgi:hypothetical protein
MDYGTLKSDFEALLNRSDNTTALTEVFIRRGISRMLRQLRVPSMEREDTLTVTNGQATVPTDYLEMIHLEAPVSWGSRKLERLEYGDWLARVSEGEPRYYARKGNKFLIKPTAATVDITYYGDLATLVADTDTDPLLDIAADAFLYAALVYAADYYVDDRAASFERMYQQIKDELEMQRIQEDFMTGPMRVQPATDQEY